MLKQLQQLAIASFTLLILLTPSNGQVIRFGQCNTDIKTVQDFNLTRYSGIWYENSKYSTISQRADRCVTAEYQLISDIEASLVVTQINALNQKESIESVARIVGPGKLLLMFSDPLSVDFVFWILSTNYTDYTVAYICNNIGPLLYSEFLSILTRERNPTQDVVLQAKFDIVAQNISLNELVPTNQLNCD